MMAKMLALLISFLLLLLAISGISQGGVPAPSALVPGPLALQIPEGEDPPDYHDPLSEWARIGHRQYALEQGIDDCLTCHNPEVFCNQCHSYVGGAPLIPTMTPEPTLPAAQNSGETPSYANDLLPILKRKCGSCHSERTAPERGGGLVLSSYDGLMTSGEDAPVVVAGDPEGSLIIQKLRGLESAGDRMPLNQDPLPDEYISLIANWIAASAPDN